MSQQLTGYRRPDGRVGIRNHVVILPVDDLSNTVCENVAQGPVAARDRGDGRRREAVSLEQGGRRVVALCERWEQFNAVRGSLGADDSSRRACMSLDDGAHVQLAPEKRFHDAVAQLVQPLRLPRLTQEQAEVLVIVIADGMATRRRIEEVRGAATLSVGQEGQSRCPATARRCRPCCSHGVCSARRGTIMPPGDRCLWPTPRLLQLLGAERLE
jgi:hypothetical protein